MERVERRLKDLSASFPSPIPEAIRLLGHLFVSPSTLLSAPLSRPVIQRFMWMRPSLDDVDESFLYFNNMIDQGVCGRIHQLRLEMIHAGSSCWQVCKPEQVEYKVDKKQSEGFLCEIFARVTVWKNEDSSNNFDSQTVDIRNKLGIILKLEAHELEEEEGEEYKKENKSKKFPDEMHQTIFKNKKLSWNYFDLQDLITPGLDSRPWFSSFASACQFNQSKTYVKESTSDDQKDYWAGYSSSSDDASSILEPNQGLPGEHSTVPIDPNLQARIQNTPLYRSKAPSVSSSIDPLDPTPLHYGDPKESPHPGPLDLLSRISRTPLYKRAPSIVDDDNHLQSMRNQAASLTVLNQLLKAAEIANLPEALSSEPKIQLGKESELNIRNRDCSQYQRITETKEEKEKNVKKNPTHVGIQSDQIAPESSTLDDHPHRVSLRLNSRTSLKELEENMLNSLRSTFSFYKMSLNLLNHQDQNLGACSLDQVGNYGNDFNSAERFIVFAHRAVSDLSSKKS